MTKSQYLLHNNGYIHHDSPDTHSASSSLNSQVSVFESEESQPIPGFYKYASHVCWLMCLFMAWPRISHKCSMQDKSENIGGHSSRSKPFCRRKSSTILAWWGLTLSSWKMAFWPIWLRYSTKCVWRISSMYQWPVKLPGTTTRSFLPLLLIPAHTITLPRLYTVVGWMQGSKCLSLLRHQTLMQPLTFCRQNLDSSEKRTRDHYCQFHLPWLVQNWHLTVLWRWESWGFLASLLALNPKVRTLFQIVCTEMGWAPDPRCCLNILSRLGPSTNRHLATVTTMYLSSRWVVHFGRPRCSMTMLWWMLNCLTKFSGWIPASKRPRTQALSSTESFLKARKGLTFTIIARHLMKDNSVLKTVHFCKLHARNAFGYVMGLTSCKECSWLCNGVNSCKFHATYWVRIIMWLWQKSSLKQSLAVFQH